MSATTIDTQIWLHVNDAIPTESFEYCKALPKYKEWKFDILRNGIKHQLLIHPSGRIGNGNARYWIAIELGLFWLPINALYYVGIWIDQYGNLCVRREYDELLEGDKIVEDIPAVRTGQVFTDYKGIVVNDEQCWAIPNPQRYKITKIKGTPYDARRASP